MARGGVCVRVGEPGSMRDLWAVLQHHITVTGRTQSNRRGAVVEWLSG